MNRKADRGRITLSATDCEPVLFASATGGGRGPLGYDDVVAVRQQCSESGLIVALLHAVGKFAMFDVLPLDASGCADGDALRYIGTLARVGPALPDANSFGCALLEVRLKVASVEAVPVADTPRIVVGLAGA